PTWRCREPWSSSWPRCTASRGARASVTTRPHRGSVPGERQRIDERKRKHDPGQPEAQDVAHVMAGYRLARLIGGFHRRPIFRIAVKVVARIHSFTKLSIPRAIAGTVATNASIRPGFRSPRCRHPAIAWALWCRRTEG